MTAQNATFQPLPPERSRYMEQAAAQAAQKLEQLSAAPVDYSPTALQLLDEWVDRMARGGSLPSTARVLAIAFLGQTFLHRHGGYWATRSQDQREHLGVVCPVAGPGEATRFIDVADQVARRVAHGIADSLSFFYLTTSVDLQGRSEA